MPRCAPGRSARCVRCLVMSLPSAAVSDPDILVQSLPQLLTPWRHRTSLSNRDSPLRPPCFGDHRRQDFGAIAFGRANSPVACTRRPLHLGIGSNSHRRFQRRDGRRLKVPRPCSFDHWDFEFRTTARMKSSPPRVMISMYIRVAAGSFTTADP